MLLNAISLYLFPPFCLECGASSTIKQSKAVCMQPAAKPAIACAVTDRRSSSALPSRRSARLAGTSVRVERSAGVRRQPPGPRRALRSAEPHPLQPPLISPSRSPLPSPASSVVLAPLRSTPVRLGPHAHRLPLWACIPLYLPLSITFMCFAARSGRAEVSAAAAWAGEGRG